MNTYECTVLVDGPKQLNKLKELFAQYAATVSDEKPWGKRLLSYPIDKKESAEYYTMKIKIDARNMAEMRKKIQYANIVIRSLFIEESRL